MKAYIGGKHNSDSGQYNRFRSNFKRTVKLVLQDDISDYRESYIDVYAKRYPAFDNMESLSHKEFRKEKWRAGWWFFQDSLPDESEWSDKIFTIGITRRLGWRRSG